MKLRLFRGQYEGCGGTPWTAAALCLALWVPTDASIAMAEPTEPDQSDRAGQIGPAAWSEATARGAEARLHGLSTLRRIVHRFDFEEGADGRAAFPNDFYRYVAPDRGFPPFGEMRLTRETAASGRCAFEFQLSGGSMAARVPTGVIPVMPLGDYIISAHVRTAGLTNARTRIAAWFADDRGLIVPGSRVETLPLKTNGQWEPVSLRVPGDFAPAVDLVIELELLQPRQWDIRAGQDSEPILDDVKGMAWFDDVQIWQLPRIDLTTTWPGQLIPQSEPVLLNVLVGDRTDEPLTATLEVFDLEDHVVATESFPAPRGAQPAMIEVGRLPGGWYRAELVIRNQRSVVASRHLGFAVLPSTERSATSRPARFGVALAPSTSDGQFQEPALVKQLGIGSARVLIGEELFSDSPASEPSPAIRQVIDDLLSDRLLVTFVIHRLPASVAAALNLDSNQVLSQMAQDPQAWQPHVQQSMLSFGRRVRCWQAGVDADALPQDGAALQAMYDQASAALGSLVPRLQLSIPWPADRPLDRALRVNGLEVVVPTSIAPESIEDYAEDWASSACDVTARLSVLPSSGAGSRERVIDLARRALHAWRAGAPHLCIDAPWTTQDEHGRTLMPQPEFVPWRVLAHQLEGRRFVGELPVGDGMRCWMLQGGQPGDDALVAWNESAPRERAFIDALLAENSLDQIDLFGNSSPIELIDGRHVIPLDAMPVFIEQIDLSLAHFLAGFKVDPAFVPAIHRPHDMDIVMTNPWDFLITGKLRLSLDDPWQITPRSREFSIQPHGEVRLPITIVFDSSVIAGQKTLVANIELQARNRYSMRVTTPLGVGMANVSLAPTWSTARNVDSGELDLLISLRVTNAGSTSVNLDAFVVAPGVSQKRRAIPSLGPGQTTTRVFQIPNGAVLLAGQRLRLGVSDRDGAARLNQVLDIPAMSVVASPPD